MYICIHDTVLVLLYYIDRRYSLDEEIKYLKIQSYAGFYEYMKCSTFRKSNTVIEKKR